MMSKMMIMMIMKMMKKRKAYHDRVVMKKRLDRECHVFQLPHLHRDDDEVRLPYRCRVV